MTRWSSIGFLVLLLLAAIACGDGRTLQTVALSPTSADARNFPNGQVQFAATGTFTQPPSPAQLTSKDVTWCVGGRADAANPTAGICEGFIIPMATVDENGVAQCTPQAQGPVYILAGKPSSKMLLPDQGSQLAVYGSAVLTCP